MPFPLTSRLQQALTAGMLVMLSLPGSWGSAAAQPPQPAESLNPVHIKFFYERPTRVQGHPGVEAVAVLGNFDLLVIPEPGELDGSDRQVVTGLLARGRQVFGYVDLAPAAIPDQAGRVSAAVDRIAAAGYTGVFFDQAGYDYGVTRAAMNREAGHARGMGLLVMMNAWHPEDILAARSHPTMNPDALPGPLRPGDWLLLESFYGRSDDQLAGEPEGSFAHVMDKYLAAVAMAHSQGVKIAGLAYHDTRRPLTDESDRERSYLLAVLLGLDGWAYGRSDNNDEVPWLALPRVDAGHRYCGAVVALGVGRWMRRTDAGWFWFQAKDEPATRQAGVATMRWWTC